MHILIITSIIAAMVKLVDTPGSGSGGRKLVRVQIPLAAHKKK